MGEAIFHFSGTEIFLFGAQSDNNLLVVDNHSSAVDICFV